jgi:predicted O-methyltransferase YrrM
MRPLRHLTPVYIYNRARYLWYEWRHPDHPWFAPDAIRLLTTLLRPTDVGIEWGSGRSTAWLAKRLKHLISVESDPHWFEKVTGMLAKAGLSNVTYVRHDVDEERQPEASGYVRAIDHYADNTVDFALIDGIARKQCVAAAIPKIAPGGLLVLDNAQWFFDYPTSSPASWYGKGFRDEEWRQLTERLSRWRLIRCTSGVNDTYIWIRPNE